MIKGLAVLVFVGASVNAQTITTETFGSGANQFSIDFVTIGNPGNLGDTTGSPNPAGGVSYNYHIGKFEVSRDFVLKAATAGGFVITMADMTSYGGNGANKPATGIRWGEAGRFVNWLNTSRGYSPAYKFDANGSFQLWNSADAGFNPSNPFRNTLAKFVIPSIHEWYKAAYGSPSNTWYNYSNGSDVSPVKISAGTSGAVYGQAGPADVNNAGSLSAWGTMAQGGNVAEWIETTTDYTNTDPNFGHWIKGGNWDEPTGIQMLSSTLGDQRSGMDPPGSVADMYYDPGFRVAMIPESSSLSLLLAGGLVLMAGRRLRRV